MKKFVAWMLCLVLCVSLCSCGTANPGNNGNNTGRDDLTAFHEKVSESQKLMDELADDIYSNWYDAIYKDKFGENIDLAIASAMVDNKENVDRIKELDGQIAELFKKTKDLEQGKLVKEVMSAYSDYYEFVINVSGSFKSYSADKETLKKELASLLRDLSYEL